MIAELPTEVQSQRDAMRSGTLPLRLFTAKEYQRMAEVGLFGEDERVELIEGRIVQMAAKNMNHAIATKRANRCLMKLLDERAVVGVQDPILLNDYSEPEPDVVLAMPPDDRYLDHHPKPEEIFLVLEIAETSLAYDRNEKCPLFAQNGIRQFCLLNLQTRELEDYREPGPDGYRSKRTYTAEESFNLVAFPKVSIKVSELLPPLKTTYVPSKRRKQ
jgi:Uma2 family endonuclease